MFDVLTIDTIELKIGNSIWLQIPQDRTIVRRVLRTVSLSLFVCMSTISVCGIIVAIALIVFNIWNNHRRWVLFFYPFLLIHLRFSVFCNSSHVSHLAIALDEAFSRYYRSFFLFCRVRLSVFRCYIAKKHVYWLPFTVWFNSRIPCVIPLCYLA